MPDALGIGIGNAVAAKEALLYSQSKAECHGHSSLFIERSDDVLQELETAAGTDEGGSAISQPVEDFSLHIRPGLNVLEEIFHDTEACPFTLGWEDPVGIRSGLETWETPRQEGSCDGWG